MPTTKRRQISQATVDRNTRMRNALELRKAGVSYSEIAKRLGWNSPKSAYTAINKALMAQMSETVEEARQIEMERLNHLLMLAWAKAQGGDLAAMDRCVMLMREIRAVRGEQEERSARRAIDGQAVLVVDGDDEADYVASLRLIQGGKGQDDLAQTG